MWQLWKCNSRAALPKFHSRSILKVSKEAFKYLLISHKKTEPTKWTAGVPSLMFISNKIQLFEAIWKEFTVDLALVCVNIFVYYCYIWTLLNESSFEANLLALKKVLHQLHPLWPVFKTLLTFKYSVVQAGVKQRNFELAKLFKL